MYKIIANGEELDTNPDLDISLNYQISDIFDPSKRSTDFSKTITLPGTPFNNKYFSQIFDVNIDNVNFNPMIKIKASISSSDNQIFTGILQLINIVVVNDKIEYEVVITGRLKNIMDRFGDYLLNQIDLSRYDHKRNIDTVQNSWHYKIWDSGSLTEIYEPGTGYVYPYIINGGDDTILNNIFVSDLFAAPYVKTVIDSLFEFTNFTYTSKFFESDYFKQLILPYIKNEIKMPDEEIQSRETIVGMGANANITVARLHDTGWWYTSSNNYNLYLTDETSSVIDNGSDLQFKDPSNQWNGTSKFTNAKAGYYDITFIGKLFPAAIKIGGGKIEFKSGNLIYQAELLLKKVGGSISILDSTATDQNPDGAYDFQMSDGEHNSPWIDYETDLGLSFEADNVFLNVGDEIFIRVGLRHPDTVNWKGLNNKMEVTLQLNQQYSNAYTKFEVVPSNAASLGNEDIKLSQMLPDTMKMKEFFISIIKAFNLVVMDNPNKEGDLIIEPRDDFFKSKQKIKDWTYKLDRSSEIKISPMSELDANNYLYTYTADEDFYNKSYTDETNKIYGEYAAIVDNDFSTKTNKLELKFSPTPNSDQFTPTRSAPYFVDFDGTSLKPKAVKPRILFYGGLINCDMYHLNLPGETDYKKGVELNRYAYCGMWDNPTNPLHDLGFGPTDTVYFETDKAPYNNLINEFHKSTLDTIIDTNSRMLEGKFQLTAVDIADFDFRDVILIDGSYWRVNIIKDYNPVRSLKLTTVKLYKIINYQKLNPFSIDISIGANECPEDIVTVTNSDRPYYKSNSGKEITKDCCTSLNSEYIDGGCYLKVGNPDVPNTGVPIDYTGSIKPVIAIKYPKPSPSVPGSSGSVSLGNLNIGLNNYIPKEAVGTVVVGNGIIVNKMSKNNIIIGSNGPAQIKPNSIQINDLNIDTGGMSNGNSFINLFTSPKVPFTSTVLFGGDNIDFSAVKDATSIYRQHKVVHTKLPNYKVKDNIDFLFIEDVGSPSTIMLPNGTVQYTITITDIGFADVNPITIEAYETTISNSDNYIIDTRSGSVTLFRADGKWSIIAEVKDLIVPPPSGYYARFTMSNDHPILDENLEAPVDFVGASNINNIVSWSWDFGDTETSTDQNPSHIYKRVGRYTVTLTVVGDVTKSIVKTNVINVGNIPVASFIADDTNPDVDAEIQFTDQSTNIPSEWLWNFGDGKWSTEQNPTHKYSITYDYTVSLKVTNIWGDDEEIKTDYITAGSSPTASFIVDDTNPEIDDEIQFTDTSINNPSEWLWDFGDSNTSTDQNPTHTYSVVGDYTVSLKVTNALGYDTETKTDYITAKPVSFIMKFNSGSDKKIIIPGSGTSNYNVVTSDAQTFNNQTGDLTITFPLTDTEYTIEISGDFPSMYMYSNTMSSTYRDKLIDVMQWGNQKWQTMTAMFYGCTNMIMSATDKPDLSGVTDMGSMFQSATSFNSDISSWDTSSVTNMRYMFLSAKAFNQPLNNWNVSGVTNMQRLFYSASSFNQPLNDWDVSGVTNMDSMFNGASSFNQPLNKWNISGITNMDSMFNGATSFNGSLNDWNVSGITDMESMFFRATNFNQPLNGWDVSGVNYMDNMFGDASSFNQPLNEWNVSFVMRMDYMFNGASSFNQDLSGWCVRYIWGPHYFKDGSALSEPHTPVWGTCP